LRFVPTIDAAGRNRQCNSALVPPLPLKIFVQLALEGRTGGIAGYDAVLDTPRLLTTAPAHQLQFESVRLDINAAGQHGDSVWQRCTVVLAPGEEFGYANAGLDLIVPGLGQDCIHEF